MIRTQISLDEDQWRRARRVAAERGMSLAGLIREALERVLEESVDAAARERAKRSVGGFHSGHRDTAEEHDAVLGEGRW